MRILDRALQRAEQLDLYLLEYKKRSAFQAKQKAALNSRRKVGVGLLNSHSLQSYQQNDHISSSIWVLESDEL